MAEDHHQVPTHPVAPRVKGTDGRPKPHIGPNKQEYDQHHAMTIGEHSDVWWAKVRSGFSSR